MFDALGSRLQAVFASFRAEVKLTPEVVERGLREIRIALLEADVNFRVTKAFIDRVRDRAVGRDVLESLTPAQQLIGVVRDELISLFGKSQEGLTDSVNRPRITFHIFEHVQNHTSDQVWGGKRSPSGSAARGS